jgi:hypothetical protein
MLNISWTFDKGDLHAFGCAEVRGQSKFTCTNLIIYLYSLLRPPLSQVHQLTGDFLSVKLADQPELADGFFILLELADDFLVR